MCDWAIGGIQESNPALEHEVLEQNRQRAKHLVALQSYLIDEFMSQAFHGTARRLWYLSDGGNFENLGGYELIRRRLPPIVITYDAAADPDYDF